MTSSSDMGDNEVYDALALPNEALSDGGTEILRAGIIRDALYVSARHAFKDPAQWGEVLADITRRLAQLYAQETDLSEAEARAIIESAFAAEMGAPVVATPVKARKTSKSRASKPKASKSKGSTSKSSKSKRAAVKRGKGKTARAARTRVGATAKRSRSPAPKSVKRKKR